MSAQAHAERNPFFTTRWRDGVVLAMVFVAGGMLTLLAAGSMQQTEALRINERKTFASQAITSAFNIGLTRTTEAIRNAGLMLESNPQLTRDQFNRYMQRLVENELSVNLMEWQPLVPADRLAQFEKAARENGLADFRVVQPDASGKGWEPVHGRQEYVPVLYAWPEQYQTVGIDMSFSPERMASKLQSRAMGQPVASGTFQFMKQGMVDSGTTAIAISTTVFDADHNARGYLAAVVDLHTLFRETERIADANKFDFLVFAKSVLTAQPIYVWRGADSDLKNASNDLRDITSSDEHIKVEFGHQNWTVVLHPRPSFYPDAGMRGSHMAFVAGLGITMLIVMALYQVQCHRRRIENAENEIKKLAFYDLLTGLPNRRLFLDRLRTYP